MDGVSIADGRVRIVMSSDKFEEVVIIVWKAGSFSAKHDHGFAKRNDAYGGSYGVTVVLVGQIKEIRTLPDGTIKTKYYDVGDKFTEDRDTLHVVGSPTGAVTKHIYIPPLTGHITEFAD